MRAIITHGTRSQAPVLYFAAKGRVIAWRKMKILLRIVGTLLALVGIVWILQGVDILPGSFMSGQPKWAINGIIAVGVGVVIFGCSFYLKKQSS
jgi:hypothetical protein